MRHCILIAASLSLGFLPISARQQTPGANANHSARRERNRFMQESRAKISPLLNIGHRGASGYAPEHTLASYELAIRQGADYVEQDLQITKDGELICSHDASLERTTNIAERFPDRATLRDPEGRGTPVHGWYACDFTLAEIKQLDAGSWFNRKNPFAARPEYEGQKIPTLAEAIRTVGGRAGLYIETKHVAFYDSLGHDMVGKLIGVLNEHKLGTERIPVLIQSFSKASLLRSKQIAPQYLRIQLLPMEDPGRRSNTAQVTRELAVEIAEYAYGIGPPKEFIQSAESVAIFHAAGLKIHPYTFRGSTNATQRKPLDEMEANGLTVKQNIISEIRLYISYGIDGGFTDYPALWAEALRSK